MPDEIEVTQSLVLVSFAEFEHFSDKWGGDYRASAAAFAGDEADYLVFGNHEFGFACAFNFRTGFQLDARCLIEVRIRHGESAELGCPFFDIAAAPAYHLEVFL